VEIFRKRKIADLREIFTSYAVLQIKLHREGIAMWTKFKKPLQAVINCEFIQQEDTSIEQEVSE